MLACTTKALSTVISQIKTARIYRPLDGCLWLEIILKRVSENTSVVSI
jgi:hypothetical protein